MCAVCSSFSVNCTRKKNKSSKWNKQPNPQWNLGRLFSVARNPESVGAHTYVVRSALRRRDKITPNTDKCTKCNKREPLRNRHLVDGVVVVVGWLVLVMCGDVVLHVCMCWVVAVSNHVGWLGWLKEAVGVVWLVGVIIVCCACTRCNLVWYLAQTSWQVPQHTCEPQHFLDSEPRKTTYPDSAGGWVVWTF